MQEEYTFSRALHLMRYGRKKMRSIKWKSKCYMFVDTFGDLKRNCGEYQDQGYLTPDEIMSSWVEVK